MNYVIVLSGGVGTRVGTTIPKQYIKVNGKPIISYCLDTFFNNDAIKGVVVVASKEWEKLILETVPLVYHMKLLGFAPAGECRNESVKNGLEKMKEIGLSENDTILIHDSARPNIDDEIIEKVIKGINKNEGAIPAISIADSIYYSDDGHIVSDLVNRSKMFAGQTPEAYFFRDLYNAFSNQSKEELASVNAPAEIAIKYGMSLNIVNGKSSNYKITTNIDLDNFINLKERQEKYKKEQKL